MIIPCSYSFNIKLNSNHFVVKNGGAVGRRRFDRSAHLTIWALHLLGSSLECVECSREQRRDLLSLHLSDRPPCPQYGVHIQVQVCGAECFYLRISATQIHPSIPSTDEPTQDIRLRIFGAIELMRFFRLILHQAKLNIIFSQEARMARMACNLNTCSTSNWAIFPSNTNRNSPFVWSV